ncbi:MAG: helix-turn-helix domain-containing protein [Bacillaceae bacterium]|nr:helix-turn-helix domain-containing protein [Bacillaceae bacterium]
MEQQTLKITGVLSDPTRFSIYQYIAKQHRDVTVHEIADAFNIHANVARLHLTKLEDVNMLVSETKKSGKGGRPSRFYSLSDEVVSIQFPYRDYQKLSEIAIDSLLNLGKIAEEALKETGRKFGYESAKSYVQTMGLHIHELTVEKKLEHIKNVALAQGLSPELHYTPETREVSFRVYNCTFKELVKGRHALCHMHHSLINGFFDFFFDEMELEKQGNMNDNSEDNFCSYRSFILPN